MLALCAQRILKIELVDPQLIGHYDVRVVGYTLGDPVMAADGFQPPNLVFVMEGDAVLFVRAVGAKQLAQAQNALSGRMDIGQYQCHQILFAYAGIDHGVRSQHALVGGDGFGRRHGNVSLVDACRAPDTLSVDGIGHGGIAHRIVRQFDFCLGEDRLINSRLVFGQNDRPFFGGKFPRAAVFRARDQGRAVIAGFFSDKQSGAGHR